MYYKNINFVIAAEDSIPTLEDAIKSVWEQLPRNGYFSGEVQWKGVNTIHGYVYGTPMYGAVTAFSYGQPLVTVRKMDNIFYVEKPVLNSDFKREIHARFPFMVYGNNLYVSYAFPIKFSTPPNISINHVDIDGYGSPDTQEVWMVNTDTVCFKFTKSTMNLQNGQCYMGQVRFMIS